MPVDAQMSASPNNGSVVSSGAIDDDRERDRATTATKATQRMLVWRKRRDTKPSYVLSCQQACVSEINEAHHSRRDRPPSQSLMQTREYRDQRSHIGIEKQGEEVGERKEGDRECFERIDRH